MLKQQYRLSTPGTAGTLVKNFEMGDEDSLLAHLKFHLHHPSQGGTVTVERVQVEVPEWEPGDLVWWLADGYRG